MGDPAYGHLAEALEAGRRRARRRWTRACGGCSRRSSGWACSTTPYVDEDRAREVLADPAHREVARIAAERSAVLLRNEGDVLPLDAGSLCSIAVIGPLADSRRDTIGPWVLRLRPGRDRDRAGGHPEQGRRGGARRVRARRPARAAGLPVDVRHVRRQRAGGPARASTTRPSSSGPSSWPGDADVAVVVVGEWQNMIGEAASRSSLELPGRQLELLQAVVETGTPVVLLVMNGRPLDLRWAAEHVPAILDIWYPGTQGGAAVANLLFGDVSPGGKLPVHLAADRRPGADGLLPHPLARAGEPVAPLLGRGEHAAVPVRPRPQLRALRATPTSPSTGRRSARTAR